MTTEAIIQMRRLEIITMNAFLFFFVFIIFVLEKTIGVTLTDFLIIVTVTLAVITVFRLATKDKSKSFLPIQRKVKEYEREKMGKQWEREQLVATVGNVVVIGIFLFVLIQTAPSNSYIIVDAFLLNIISIMGVGLNVGAYIRTEKVEKVYRHENEKEMRKILNKLKPIVISFVLLYGLITIVTFSFF